VKIKFSFSFLPWKHTIIPKILLKPETLFRMLVAAFRKPPVTLLTIY
jgi:hypothetical protein